MNLTEFKKRLDVIRLSGSDKRQISALLRDIDDNVKLEGVVSYVQAHVADNDSVPFLASLIVHAATKLDDTITLELARHLRSNSTLEDSDLFEALRTATGGRDDHVVQLFQKLVLESDPNDVQPDLLFVFPEMKLRHSELFLESIKRCAILDDDISFSGVVSSYVSNLPPDADNDIAGFIREAVLYFDDEGWLNQIGDERLVEILAGLISLASILLDVDLIRLTLSFLLRAFRGRTPSSAIVRVLATPYTMWMHEVGDLIPDLNQAYQEELASVHSGVPIEQACKQLNELVFVNQKHLEMKVNPRILGKQKWREYRKQRLQNA